MDYLSWDEEAPTRRSEVLRRYLPEGADTTLGWSGVGRQRTEFARSGLIQPDAYRLWIDVRVRVTPYERTEQSPTSPETPAEDALPTGARWSAAPPPVGHGWLPGAAFWVRLAIPVRRHDCGDLVVDLSTIPDPADTGSSSD